MKRLLFLTVITCLILNVHVHAQVSKSNSAAKSMADASMPYTATYSSQFVLGDAKYSAEVLKAWKSYDNNTLDDVKDMFADTVTAITADGTMLKGKDNVFDAMKQYRGTFSSVSSQVAAWLPVKSTDLGIETVCIWGTETDNKSDGTKQSVNLHEVWFFNKDGKVMQFRQYTEAEPKGGQ